VVIIPEGPVQVQGGDGGIEIVRTELDFFPLYQFGIIISINIIFIGLDLK
jgi:hypothetical protein